MKESTLIKIGLSLIIILLAGGLIMVVTKDYYYASILAISSLGVYVLVPIKPLKKMNEKLEKLLSSLILLSVGVYLIIFNTRETSALSLICGWGSGALYVSTLKIREEGQLRGS